MKEKKYCFTTPLVTLQMLEKTFDLLTINTIYTGNQLKIYFHLQVMMPNLAFEKVRFTESENLWIGPRQVRYTESENLWIGPRQVRYTEGENLWIGPRQVRYSYIQIY